MVRQPPLEDFDKDEDWERMPTPLLVVEVSSRSTLRRDIGPKRAFYYVEVGVPEYRFVDRPYRSLQVVRPGQDDLVVADRYRWQPSGAPETLVVDVQPLFG